MGDAPHEGEQLIAVERLAQVPVRAGATLTIANVITELRIDGQIGLAHAASRD